MNRILGSLAGVLALGFAAAPPLHAGGLDCTLTAEKAKVMVAEPIWLRLHCVNTGDQSTDLDFATAGALAWATKPAVGGPPCDASTFPAVDRVVVPPWQVAVPAGGSVDLRVLLSRWLRVQQPGVLRVALEQCVNGAKAVAHTDTLTIWQPFPGHVVPLTGDVAIEVVPTDDDELRRICELLTAQALQRGQADEGLQAAEALASIGLPLAVPYLERVLALHSLGAVLAANGLARIGDAEAIKALILAFDHAFPWARMAIKNRLLDLKPRPRDPELQARLESILRQEAVKVVEPR
jgi:hypothetical protein